MDTTEIPEEAIEVLQQFGLKEYEARCFVGLTRLNTGTAKELSDLTGVPRTRVYDAIRVLEAKDLVEIKHSSPQRFRAVSLDEATGTLRDQHEVRVERLRAALDTIDAVDDVDESALHQIWVVTGRDAVEDRTVQHIEQATDEVVLVIGDESLLTADLIDTLNRVGNGIDLVIGTSSEPLREQVNMAVPDATTFRSGHEWLHGETATEDGTAIGRLLLVDRSTILVSSITPDAEDEQAIFGEGFGNGLGGIARRLMARGLISARDPR